MRRPFHEKADRVKTGVTVAEPASMRTLGRAGARVQIGGRVGAAIYGTHWPKPFEGQGAVTLPRHRTVLTLQIVRCVCSPRREWNRAYAAGASAPRSGS